MATYVVIASLIILSVFAIVKIVKDRKKGGCGGNCSGCSMQCSCQNEASASKRKTS